MSAATRIARSWLVGPLAIAAIAAIAASGVAAAPVPGGQGTDTSLPATGSLVTINGRGAFTSLAITVNQTNALTNQAVSITWTGGTPTQSGAGRFDGHYLQVMQCWGDDDGTVPENPGPPPEQCVQGAVAGTFGGVAAGRFPGGLALTRIISRSTWPNFDASLGVFDDRTGQVWRPFRAVDGTEIGVHEDPTFVPFVVGGSFWLNPYFDIVKTNEIGGAVTGRDGRGAELFEVLTGVQSSGLGCGQRTQPVAGGGRKVPKCWIVVVPRGAPADENVGTPFEANADQIGVYTSPLSPAAWQQRIAIPIEFNPVDSPCSLADVERRVAGSELAQPAVSSWQPALCAGGALPPYSYAPLGDAAARQLLTNPVAGAPGMIVVSRPIPATAVNPAKPVVYAPLSVSGLVIGMNVERSPRFDAPEAAQLLSGVRVAELNLTPRLVAKLLTQSYSRQVTIIQPPNYEWIVNNPTHLGVDPDFLQFNPEFEQLEIFESRNFSGLQLPAGNSDAARQVWDWVLSDPEARAWLEGGADAWGMRVNPVYATVATVNPSGIAFGDPLPSSFPKADPNCYQAPPRGINNSIVPPLLCGTDWMPYARGFADAAVITRKAFDGARISENPYAQSASEVWSRGLPQILGRKAILSVTDTTSAAQYGIQMARLSRAGDDGPDRAFIAANAASLQAGVASMEPGDNPDVLEPSPTTQSPNAYPLTTMTYAAISPLAIDDQARDEYAAFIEYAAGAGQVPGPAFGQLPNGYLPLPAALRTQAASAANLVRDMLPAPVAPVTATTTQPTTTTEQAAAAEQAAAVQPTTTRRATTSRPTAQPDAAIETPAATESSSPTEPLATTDLTDDIEPAALPEVDEPESSGSTLLTPILSMSRSRFAVPGIGVMAMASALGALEITKRPRRSLFSDIGDSDPVGDD